MSAVNGDLSSKLVTPSAGPITVGPVASAAVQNLNISSMVAASTAALEGMGKSAAEPPPTLSAITSTFLPSALTNISPSISLIEGIATFKAGSPSFSPGFVANMSPATMTTKESAAAKPVVERLQNPFFDENKKVQGARYHAYEQISRGLIANAEPTQKQCNAWCAFLIESIREHSNEDIVNMDAVVKDMESMYDNSTNE